MLRARVRECARGRPRTLVRRYVSFSLLRLPDPKNLLVAGPPPSPSLGAHCPIERGMETFPFLKDPPPLAKVIYNRFILSVPSF